MRGLTTLWIENPLITSHSKNTFDKYITNSFLDNVSKGALLYQKENDIIDQENKEEEKKITEDVPK